MAFYSKWSNREKLFGSIALILVAIFGFNEIRKANERARVQAQIDAIDVRMSTGRASAAELVELRLRKKAILQQYLNLI